MGVKERVLEIVSDESIEEDKALTLEEGQKPVPISKENFHKIDSSKKSEVAFIDGGNAEVLGAASFSLQLIRGAVVKYEGREKTGEERESFELLVTLEDGGFEVQTFPETAMPKLEFDNDEPGLKTGEERVRAQKIASVCRRLFELKLAKDVDADYIVLDGSLYSRVRQEEQLLQVLRKKDSAVTGLSKTSGLMTERGRVFSAAISSLKNGSWYYKPVFEGGGVEVLFARLNENSNHVFRIDTFDFEESLLKVLKSMSNDPVFPGYPYGLIEADKKARVSNRERDYRFTQLKSEFGGDWERIKPYLHTSDAHEVLDNI